MKLFLTWNSGRTGIEKNNIQKVEVKKRLRKNQDLKYKRDCRRIKKMQKGTQKMRLKEKKWFVK